MLVAHTVEARRPVDDWLGNHLSLRSKREDFEQKQKMKQEHGFGVYI